MYGGYPMEANPNRVHYYLTYERLHDRDGFPWGAYHEVGHGHQESVWTMGFWECTVNWFSVVMTEVEYSLLKCINKILQKVYFLRQLKT